MLRAVDKRVSPKSAARFYSLCKSNAHWGKGELPRGSMLNSLCQKPIFPFFIDLLFLKIEQPALAGVCFSQSGGFAISLELPL